jgi:transposase
VSVETNMPTRKKCGSGLAVRSGVVAGKQRWRCKECGCNFREGDGRTGAAVAAKKAMCVLLCAMAKGPFRALGRMPGRSHTLIYRWVRDFGGGLPEPGVPGDVREIEFDEMRHFVESKKTGLGSSRSACGAASAARPLIAAHGEPLTVRKRRHPVWPGCSEIVMLQHSGGSTAK